MIYRPKDLHQFLHTLHASPKKSLSQNFLVDANIIRKIVATAEIKEGDSVLEIGPGPGALTQALLEKKAKVTAVEKDRKFAEALKRFPEVVVYQEDILNFSWEKVQRGKVVANLPYHLTSPILGLLLPRHDLFSKVTLMVQKEVARRMMAQAKTKEYSALTLFVNFYSTPSYAFTVSRHCFYPSPKVDSAVMVFDLKKPLLSDETTFFNYVRTLFCHRRKMIRSILSKERVEEELIKLGLPITSRPEELTLEQHLILSRNL